MLAEPLGSAEPRLKITALACYLWAYFCVDWKSKAVYAVSVEMLMVVCIAASLTWCDATITASSG